MTELRPRLLFPPFLLLLLSFSGGALLERAGWIPGRAGCQPREVGQSFEPFWEAWQRVRTHFVDRDKVQNEALMQGALSGMIQSLGDAGHTTYLTREQRTHLENGLSGQMEGIGTRIAFVRRRTTRAAAPSRRASAARWRAKSFQTVPTIAQTMPGSPARAAGLRRGDVLLAVDGQEVRGERLARIASRLRGKLGEQVQLRLARVGRPRPIDVAVRRARVEVPDVDWQMLPGAAPIAHVALHRFGKGCSGQLRDALDAVKQKGARGVVLDLRGNPGGLKEQAVAVAGELLAEGKVVLVQEDAKGQREQLTAQGEEGRWREGPLVVLVNGGSASSAEIVAGALQDNGRAKVVGTRSFGTGTVLREYPLSDGSAVLLAVSLWRTPGGRQIWRQGIAPDVVVTLPASANLLLPDDQAPLTAERFAACDDAPLRKAHALLLQEMR